MYPWNFGQFFIHIFINFWLLSTIFIHCFFCNFYFIFEAAELIYPWFWLIFLFLKLQNFWFIHLFFEKNNFIHLFLQIIFNFYFCYNFTHWYWLAMCVNVCVSPIDLRVHETSGLEKLKFGGSSSFLWICADFWYIYVYLLIYQDI